MKSSLDVALHFLKFRPRSVFEVKQKLKQKSFSQEEIDQTVDVLVRNELLDDAKFVKMYVKDRNTLKPTGLFLLKMQLKRLGVADYLIEENLANQDEEELARKLIESKSRFDKAEFNKKANFLQRHGFSMNVIMKVLKSQDN